MSTTAQALNIGDQILNLKEQYMNLHRERPPELISAEEREVLESITRRASELRDKLRSIGFGAWANEADRTSPAEWREFLRGEREIYNLVREDTGMTPIASNGFWTPPPKHEVGEEPAYFDHPWRGWQEDKYDAPLPDWWAPAPETPYDPYEGAGIMDRIIEAVTRPFERIYPFVDRTLTQIESLVAEFLGISRAVVRGGGGMILAWLPLVLGGWLFLRLFNLKFSLIPFRLGIKG